MPTWTHNRIEVTGDPTKRQAFRDAVAGADGVMDFGRVKPMPRELAINEGSSLELGLASLSQTHFDTLVVAPWFTKQYPRIRDMRELRVMLERSEPETVALGRQGLANIRAYGVPTWYGWCTREWGTKWGACHTEFDDAGDCLTYWFDTAHEAPRGVVGPLVDLAHSLGLSVVWECQDEGGGLPETLVDDLAESAA